jgi:hypothetical protein
VVGLPPVALVPSALVRRLLLHPMRYHVAGTMLACALAMEVRCPSAAGWPALWHLRRRPSRRSWRLQPGQRSPAACLG